MRPANVATAAADVLAGYAVAGLANAPALPWLLLSTTSLYAGGIVLNDYFDRDVDRVERPERPIPGGRVSPAAARRLGGILVAVGVLAATQATTTAAAIAALTAAAILLYNAWAKRHAVVGPATMGLCRALNLALGIAAVPAALVVEWPLLLVPFVYITAVTVVSRGEVHGGTRGIAAGALISLVIVVSALLVIAARVPDRPSIAGLVLALAVAWRVLPPFWRVCRVPEHGPIRQAVRAGVLSLVLVDAAIGATYGGAPYSLVILATGLLSVGLARLFPVT